MQPEHTFAEHPPFTRFAVVPPACMGGRCDVRNGCAHYHAADRRDPSERLCSPGRRDAWQPVNVTRELSEDPSA